MRRPLRPLTPFETYLVEEKGLLDPTARTYGGALARVRTVATEEEILTGDITEIADRHRQVRMATIRRYRRASPLRRAIRRYREFRGVPV